MNLALLTVPNSLSLARGMLAFLLLIDIPLVRVCVVLVCALTDFFDGFLARRWQQISRFGTLIDPITDKLFVGVALTLFFCEGKLTGLECLSFLFRDLSLLIFTGWLLLLGRYQKWQVRSFICGKITTALQFLVLLGLCLDMEVMSSLYYAMASFGLLSLFELVYLC
ncbi:MAG: CDP-alcohol phosphatidyltransferase family protein, partial [Verrucomicrobia bacterium]|nr:CDP-alcohol phosphatidyltransferase family protein [Verrucomicrobiota bacterium]